MTNHILGMSEVQRGVEPMQERGDPVWPQWMVNAATGEKKILPGPAEGWVTKDEYRMMVAEETAKALAGKRGKK